MQVDLPFPIGLSWNGGVWFYIRLGGPKHHLMDFIFGLEIGPEFENWFLKLGVCVLELGLTRSSGKVVFHWCHLIFHTLDSNFSCISLCSTICSQLVLQLFESDVS
jgi:hypothetical protein